ncbi:MAG: hypothetical protein H6937_00475 [Burkholderiales bacterium]|nr:hypothetical protein [Burkholderiales bacterium]
MDELAEQIRQLELKLLHMDWRVDPAAIDELLDETFEEIGGNGQISARQNVVGWLLKKTLISNGHYRIFALNDYRVIRSSPYTVL